MWLFPSFLNHLFLSCYLFLLLFPPKWKEFLQHLCVSKSATLSFFSCKILQESCLNKCPSVSLLQVTLECTLGLRAQQGSWLSHECELKRWLTGRYLHFNDRHPEMYKRSRQVLTQWPLLWQAYHMPPLIRNFQCPRRVPCQLLFSFVFPLWQLPTERAISPLGSWNEKRQKAEAYTSCWVHEWEVEINTESCQPALTVGVWDVSQACSQRSLRWITHLRGQTQTPPCAPKWPRFNLWSLRSLQTDVCVSGCALSVYSQSASPQWRFSFKTFAETTPELPTRPVALRTGFPGGASGKEPMRHKRRGFYPWVGKIPPEEEMTTHSSILAWEIPRAEEPGGLQSMGLQKSQTGRKELSPHAAGMLDLSSLTWDRTCAAPTGRQSLNHWTTREVPWGGGLI